MSLRKGFLSRFRGHELPVATTVRMKGDVPMEKTYKIDFVEKTPLIKVDGKYVFIDTGSPKTICEQGVFRFIGTDHPVKTSLGLARLGAGANTMTIERLRRMLNHEVSVKLGMDILSRYHILFDYRSSRVTFSDGPLELDADLHEMPLVKGRAMPVLDFVVGGRSVSCYCDTGSSCSILEGSMARAGRFLRSDDARSAMAGDHKVSLYKVQVGFGGREFDAECIEMDDKHARVTAMKGAEGLMGYDFFYHHRVLLGDGMIRVARC